ncbi:MAG: hypothetical protein H7227_01515 [Actinobacteria bacterium]|nr:hypothetical protein [Actinomycetota bacterium]
MRERIEVEMNKGVVDQSSENESSHEHHHLSRVVFAVILTLALTGAGVNYAQSHGFFQDNSAYVSEHFIPMAEHSGRVGLTVIGLTNHIILPNHAGGEYWLGAKDGYSYTTSCVIPGELKVTYLPPGASPSNLTSPQLSVTAYENQKYFDLANKSYKGSFIDHATNNHGDTLSFDGETRIAMKVALFSSAEIVLVKYPSQQSVESLLADSMKLRLVSAMNILG